MQLARAAAARTLANWAEPEAAPATKPQSTQAAEPHSESETAPHANPAPTPRRAASYLAGTASHKQIDPAVLFTRLAAVVRDCVALEARLTTGTGARIGGVGYVFAGVCRFDIRG